jgi:hypothetical protein
MTYKRRRRPFITSRMYGFNLARQLDGTMDKGPRYGSYVLTVRRVHAGWGCVAEWRWPRPVVWPPQEPPGLDRSARFNRHRSHFRVRDLHDAKMCLWRAGPFGFAVPITRQWRKAPAGVITLPRDRSEFEEAQHAVTAVQYDDRTRLIKFMNCWGSEWGDGGLGYLPYEYFEAYVSDAWFESPMGLGHWLPAPTPEGFCRERRIFINALGHPCGTIDIWNTTDDIRIGWCFMTYRDGYLDVEDYFLRPGFHGSGHQVELTRAIINFARGLKLRVWVPHADCLSSATNFANLQDFLRSTAINVRPSPRTWAAYVGEAKE